MGQRVETAKREGKRREESEGRRGRSSKGGEEGKPGTRGPMGRAKRLGRLRAIGEGTGGFTLGRVAYNKDKQCICTVSIPLSHKCERHSALLVTRAGSVNEKQAIIFSAIIFLTRREYYSSAPARPHPRRFTLALTLASVSVLPSTQTARVVLCSNLLQTFIPSGA